MSRLPFRYIWRSLAQRSGSTALTVGSFLLVVLILIALLAMVRGIDASLVGSGAADRFFVINQNATTENQSQLTEQEAQAVSVYPQIKLDAQARPVTSYELVATTYVTGPDDQQAQMNVRGVDLPDALAVHDQFRLASGRLFSPDAADEVVAGRGAAEALGLGVGDTFSTKQYAWRIVGLFSDDGSPFESEIWTSRTNMELAFDKDYISSVWALVRDPQLTDPLVTELNADPALSVYALTETDYFAQGAGMATELQALAWFVAVLMSIGAVFSAMNTMYASVADRAREMGTMRALGFPPSTILRATVLESLLLAAAGALLACMVAVALNGLTFRMLVTGLGFVSFQFVVTPDLLFMSVLFSLVMGLVGGYLPARRATQVSIIDALKG